MPRESPPRSPSPRPSSAPRPRKSRDRLSAIGASSIFTPINSGESVLAPQTNSSDGNSLDSGYQSPSVHVIGGTRSLAPDQPSRFTARRGSPPTPASPASISSSFASRAITSTPKHPRDGEELHRRGGNDPRSSAAHAALPRAALSASVHQSRSSIIFPAELSSSARPASTSPPL